MYLRRDVLSEWLLSGGDVRRTIAADVWRCGLDMRSVRRPRRQLFRRRCLSLWNRVDLRARSAVYRQHLCLRRDLVPRRLLFWRRLPRGRYQ